MLKRSERHLPEAQRRGIHRAVLMDQDGTKLIGSGPVDRDHLGVRGGQGRTAASLTRPWIRPCRVAGRMFRTARSWLVRRPT